MNEIFFGEVFFSSEPVVCEFEFQQQKHGGVVGRCAGSAVTVRARHLVCSAQGLPGVIIIFPAGLF